MDRLKERLSDYGNVITCEAGEEFLTVNMTMDKPVTVAACKCLGIIQEEVGDRYTNTKSCDFTNKSFNCVLRAIT